jgi:glucoamylase
LARGIVTEVYYPWVDHAALRDVQFVVTGEGGYFSNESCDTVQEIMLAAPGVPAYRLTNTCKHGRYRLVKEILTDPGRDTLLQRVRFIPLGRQSPSDVADGDLRLFMLLHPRLGDRGQDNSARTGEFKGRPMLFARNGANCLAAACSAGWKTRSVGYVGSESDPLEDLRRNGHLTGSYTRADEGHVALAGEIDWASCGGEFLLACGFDRSPAAAGLTAAMSLMEVFESARERFIEEWKEWQQELISLDRHEASARDGLPASAGAAAGGWQRPNPSRPAVPAGADEPPPDLYRMSTMVLRIHRSLHFSGAGVASLTVPWGEARGDHDLGGYHLVWARDLVEEASALLAMGAYEDARRVIGYLRCIQDADGHWPQDMWLDGTPYMDAVQLDESALPILLVDLARRVSALDTAQCCELWPMVRSAAEYLLRRGPATNQDRWENTPGYSPYTLATEIAALLAAAYLAALLGEGDLAERFRRTADEWNGSIEHWTYVRGTDLARRAGVEGYYVRVAPPAGRELDYSRTREQSAHDLPVSEVVSADALALVRFGLRSAHDPRIVTTVKAIDAATRVQTPYGPCWRRYNGDYYGEHADGTPFLGRGDYRGCGRAWPLLTGERGHYELAAGRPDEARRMLAAMTGFASTAGMLPEQVWDNADLPGQNLYCGRPSRSAMPLAWTHSEYVRLLRSIRDGRVFDMPPQSYERYVKSSAGGAGAQG